MPPAAHNHPRDDGGERQEGDDLDEHGERQQDTRPCRAAVAGGEDGGQHRDSDEKVVVAPGNDGHDHGVETHEGESTSVGASTPQQQQRQHDGEGVQQLEEETLGEWRLAGGRCAGGGGGRERGTVDAAAVVPRGRNACVGRIPGVLGGRVHVRAGVMHAHDAAVHDVRPDVLGRRGRCHDGDEHEHARRHHDRLASEERCAPVSTEDDGEEGLQRHHHGGADEDRGEYGLVCRGCRHQDDKCDTASTCSHGDRCTQHHVDRQRTGMKAMDVGGQE